ncbi:MAG: hypothetical protein CMO98_08215 [Woeseia sp.]|nr:hypothetical protein [Woeseia sp.]|tara:strand:- start:1073 stop:1615 length:543 start_codon:yes stop_codon:yes gene_type:complete
MSNRTIFNLIVSLIALQVSTSVSGTDVAMEEHAILLSIEAIHEGSELVERGYPISSGQPDPVTLVLLKEAGYKAVIDMRTLLEDRGFNEPALVGDLGMDYYSLPVDGARGVTFENAIRLDRILKTIDGPVFLHCKSGNRVGALLALRASIHGASDEDALVIGKKGGVTSHEHTVRHRLAE